MCIKMTQKTLPRITPSRDEKYMGLAWINASFSKDPNTQVGSVLVSRDNHILGSGYNGPPRNISDELVTWDRPSKDSLEILSKYDLIVHAEINAMDESFEIDLTGSTLYVTAIPCPQCMLQIIKKKIYRIVYCDFKCDENSILKNDIFREKTEKLATLSGVSLERFGGNINWLLDWTSNLKKLGVFNV